MKASSLFEGFLLQEARKKVAPPEEEEVEEEPVEDNDVPDDMDVENIDSTAANNNLNPPEDPNMMMGGIPEPEPPLDPTDIGKIQHLKKLYIRMIILSKSIDHYSNPEFDALKDELYEALDLFHVIISNIDTMMEKINIIINLYNEFILDIISRFEKLTKKHS